MVIMTLRYKIQIVWSRISPPEGSNGPAPSPHHLPRASQDLHGRHEGRSRPSTPKEKAIKKISNQIFYSNIFNPEDSHLYRIYGITFTAP